MLTSTILFASMVAAQGPSQNIVIGPIPNYKIVNAVANPGFESGLSSWSTSNSFVDPNWYGDPEQYEPLYGEGTTSYTKRSGSFGYQFGLTPEYGFGDAFVFSEIHQSISPVNTNSITSAYFYAWSTASSWGPQTVGVEVQYSDATPSQYYQDITGHYYTPQPGEWKKVDFKSALKPGKTVTKITIATQRYPYEGTNLWIDDVMIGKKVPLVYYPYLP